MRLCVAMSTGRNWVLGSQTSHYVSENALCLQFIWLLIMDAVKGVLLFTFLQEPLDCLHANATAPLYYNNCWLAYICIGLHGCIFLPTLPCIGLAYLCRLM